MTMRLISAGQDRASAAIANQSAVDGLSGSGYASDGSDFAGFTAPNAKQRQTWDDNGLRDAAHPSYGAKGQVGFDNHAAFLATNAAVGQLGAMRVLPDAASYEVHDDLTIDCAELRMIFGARIKPMTKVDGSPVTITVLALPTGHGKWMDYSGGGTFKFLTAGNTPNQYIREYNLGWACWLNGATDDSANARNFANSVPDDGKIVQPHHSCMALAYLLPIIGRTGLRILGDARPMDAFDGTPTCSWKWIGAPGGTMLADYNNGYLIIEGIFIQLKNAAVWRDTDGLKVGTTQGSTTITIDGASTASGPDFLKWMDTTSAALPVTFNLAGAGATPLRTTIVPGSVSADGRTATIAVAAGSTNTLNSSSLGVGIAPYVAGQSRISTWCETRFCKVIGGAGNQSFDEWRIGFTWGGNVDFTRGYRNYWAGAAQNSETVVIPQLGLLNGLPQRGMGFFNSANAGGYTATGLRMTAGSNVILCDVATFDVDQNNRRLQMEHGGADNGTTGNLGPRGEHSSLDGFLLVDTSQSARAFTDRACTIPLNAPRDINATVLGHEPFMYIGQAFGTGIRLCADMNSHQNVYVDQQFVSLHEGCHSDAGSFELHNCWGADNDLNVYAGNAIQLPCAVYNFNSENCRQHIFMDAGIPFIEENCRHFVWNTPPSNGFFRIFTSSPRYENKNLKVEGNVGPGQAVWNLPPNTQSLRIVHTCASYFHTKTISELGWTDAAFVVGGSIDYEDLAFPAALPIGSGGDGLATRFKGKGTIVSAFTRDNTDTFVRLRHPIIQTTGGLPPDSEFVEPGELAFFANNGAITAKALYRGSLITGTHFLPKGGVTVSPGVVGLTLNAGQATTVTVTGVAGVNETDGVVVGFSHGAFPMDPNIVLTARVTQSDNGTSNGIITITAFNPTAGSILMPNGQYFATTIAHN